MPQEWNSAIETSRTSRALGFALIPFLSVAGPILILPIITARFGAAAWVAVAVGQSIGMALITVVELGWALNGPQRVARMSANHTYRVAILSFQTKLLLFPLFALAAMAASYFLTTEYRLDSALTAMASLAAAFSMAWVFLGESKPWSIIFLDSLPRLLGVVGAATILYLGGPLWIYPVCGLLFPAIVSPIISLARVRTRSSLRPMPLAPRRQVLWSVRAQRHAMSARLASSAYMALPIVLVTLVAPSPVAVFAAGERLMRMGLNAIVVFPNAMQSWVGSVAHREARMARARKAIIMNASLGVVAGVVFGLFAPFASRLLFSGVATIPTELAWLFSIVILVICTSRATGGIGLVALNRVRVLALSAVIGATVGVPAILILAAIHGPVGGAVGEIVAETAVLGVQLRGFARRPTERR